MKAEGLARLFVIGVIVGLPLALVGARWVMPRQGAAIEVHGQMAEEGGWTPGDLTARVGKPLHLRLVSDDVMHSFAVGGMDAPAVDMPPGQPVETTLNFERPGKYVFYCTRWCGANHWRMRGTIEVSGEGKAQSEAPAAGEKPLYLELGLDLDAPHPAAIVPTRVPSAQRGAALGLPLPVEIMGENHLRQAPVETFTLLRAGPFTAGLSDEQVWDLVALAWQRSTTPERLEQGRQLYAQNCAACHGETGRGDGVMAGEIAKLQPAGMDADHAESAGHPSPGQGPADFTDPAAMLGASPVLLEGKIIRGGMGTGMPYWGPIFTPEQVRALVDYLYTFQFQTDGGEQE
jgi:mono/diheme cytochrome c family protein